MNGTIPGYLHRQRGVATLLIALVLMLAVTVLTLSVARSSINQTNIDNNQQWHDHLFIAAESAIERLLPDLTEIPESEWRRLPGEEQDIWQQSENDNQITTDLQIIRSPLPRRFITIQASTRRSEGSGPGVQITRQFRELGILSPLGELAPPLVTRGCPTDTALNQEIYPRDADSNKANVAIWLTDGACPASEMDTHGGAIQAMVLPDELWDALFTLDREAYAELVEQEQRLPASQRRYWIATPADLDSQGRWSRSLGTVDQHRLLYFPPETGCPEFAAGVRLYGVVFIDAPCPRPLARLSLDLYGTLIVNGRVNLGPGAVQLANIQLEDSRQAALRFPALRLTRVPGTWRDF
ncbi:hypothetical protein MNBD_GAMMA14-985 [hydrothermal vent metagenome]|uniref:Type 4 fimbrial biogenesis protein PilX N-terminal domain-containing protein n=1 Tax=hydrothermal vent metagenome TaxID=652676 RepID=A0A3B0Y5N3_9ZZZZ